MFGDSLPRMVLPVHLAQPLPVHVRVDLRRPHIGMPQQLLDDAQVRPA